MKKGGIDIDKAIQDELVSLESNLEFYHKYSNNGLLLRRIDNGKGIYELKLEIGAREIDFNFGLNEETGLPTIVSYQENGSEGIEVTFKKRGEALVLSTRAIPIVESASSNYRSLPK